MFWKVHYDTQLLCTERYFCNDSLLIMREGGPFINPQVLLHYPEGISGFLIHALILSTWWSLFPSLWPGITIPLKTRTVIENSL